MFIEILLSTYNGEAYLRQQLDSILAQTYQDFRLTVRDDGSTDGTWDILAEYAAHHPDRITLMPADGNRGYPDCFWYLLEHAGEADLYAFCDQDDVWDTEKLANCAEKCRGENPENPLLYVHDYRVADGELNIYDEYHIRKWGYREDDPYKLLYFVMMSGFAMVLNARLRSRILQDDLYRKNIPHDRWIFWSGFFTGKILCDERMAVTYRRHDRTVTVTGKGNAVFLRDWWKNEVWGTRMNRWEETGLLFADLYSTEMERKQPGIIEEWRLLYKNKKGAGAYLRRLMFPKRLKPTIAGEIALRICFLLNK